MHTYTAAITTNGLVTEIFGTSTDYESLAEKFEEFRLAHFKSTKVWLGGFVTQEKVKVKA